MYTLVASKALLTFPLNFPLEEALDMIRKWNPDTMDYDIINGRVVVHVTRKSPRFNQRVKKLVDAGVIIESTRFMLPPLSNPDISKYNSDSPDTYSLDEQALRRIIREEYNSNVTDDNIRLQEENSKLRFDIIRLQKELEREREIFDLYRKRSENNL